MTRNYDAFTLAEVLITLVIVGVIASMTIPTLINKTNKQEYVSRLKKTYSTLSQATNRIIAEEGTPKASVGGWATSAETVYNMYKKYLNKAKECGDTSGCFTGKYKKIDLSQIDINFETIKKYALILGDGAEVLFFDGISPNCSNASNGAINECSRIMVDINGQKNPNIIGRDVFVLSLNENGLIPVGCVWEDNGWGCACKVLRENAMNY